MERDVFLERAFPGERQIAMYPAQIPLKTKRQWRGIQGLSAAKNHEICWYNTCSYIRTCTNPVENVRLLYVDQKTVWANIWPFTCTDWRDPKHTELDVVVSDLRVAMQMSKHVAAKSKDCIHLWQNSTFDGVIQGESLARGPKLLSIKNYVIEIMTWKFIYTYRERCKTGSAHNRCWNWSPFTSKLTWMRFSKFWNTFPKVSTLRAWISWRIASLSCSIVRGVFLYTLPFNRPQTK